MMIRETIQCSTPKSSRHAIFDHFHRDDPARTRKVEGIELGLSLTREIARAHGGDLTLASTSPGQAAFTLTLPIGAKKRSGRA
jgi:signal transduction histidine kinase